MCDTVTRYGCCPLWQDSNVALTEECGDCLEELQAEHITEVVREVSEAQKDTTERGGE